MCIYEFFIFISFVLAAFRNILSEKFLGYQFLIVNTTSIKMDCDGMYIFLYKHTLDFSFLTSQSLHAHILTWSFPFSHAITFFPHAFCPPCLLFPSLIILTSYLSLSLTQQFPCISSSMQHAGMYVQSSISYSISISFVLHLFG